MTLAEALSKMDAIYEAERERVLAWCRAHCASIAAELQVPTETRRALDKGLAVHLAYLKESHAMAHGDMLLMAGLDAVPDWLRGG